MSHFAGTNPWLSMWSQPRDTIRMIQHANPQYGIYLLSTLYCLENCFFFSNWWSLGVSIPLYVILLVSLVISPIAGLIWLYYTGAIYQITGRLLARSATPPPSTHIRAAIAWSKIPISINLFMWLILLAAQPHDVFIQDGTGPSSIFVNFITLVANIWSFILLIQTIRETQGFSFLRSLVNVLLASLISSVILFLIFNITRYLYI